MNAEGYYKVRIYEPSEAGFGGTWVEVEVDDRLPCRSGDLVFAQNSSGEIWVPLVEKAYAKYLGSYSKLSGGFPTLALTAMTGSKFNCYMFGSATIPEVTFGSATMKSVADGGAVSARTTGRSFNTNSFWKKLVTYDEKDYIMTLASHGQDEYSEGGSGPQEKTGLVGGHAYSLIAVKEVGRFRLLNVRNPWGSFEWGGDWSDGSPLWDQYPEVKEAIDPSMDFTDGDFWMDYDTALEKFSMVTVNYIKRAELEKHVSNDDDDTEESAPQPWLPPVSPIQKEVMEFLRRSPKFKQVAKHLFDEANVNGDDVVSKDELQEWTEKNWSQLTGVLGGHMSIILSPPSKETLMCIFDQSDYTGDGNLNINEYELFCATLLKEMATTAASNWKRAVQNGFQNGLRKLGDLPKVLVVPLVGIGLVLLSRR
eukprot:gene10837-12821_t